MGGEGQRRERRGVARVESCSCDGASVSIGWVVGCGSVQFLTKDAYRGGGVAEMEEERRRRIEIRLARRRA